MQSHNENQSLGATQEPTPLDILDQINKDLNPKNHKLLSEEEIKELTKHKPKEKKTSIFQFKKYEVIFLREDSFAIYPTLVDEVIGDGFICTLRYAQNLKTGKWCFYREQTILKKNEEKILSDIHLFEALDLLLPQSQSLIEFLIKSKDGNQHKRQGIFLKSPQGKNLFYLTASGQALSYQSSLTIIIQIVCIMEELLKKRILFCDINLEKIYYDFDLKKMELVDFNSAGYTNEKREIKTRLLYGTQKNWAPELCENQQSDCTYNEKTLVYNLGILFAQMLGLAGMEGNFYGARAEEFAQNKHIPDAKKREEILEFLFSMAEDMAKGRPSLKQIRDFFIQKLNTEKLMKRLPKEFTSVFSAIKLTYYEPKIWQRKDADLTSKSNLKRSPSSESLEKLVGSLEKLAEKELEKKEESGKVRKQGLFTPQNDSPTTEGKDSPSGRTLRKRSK